MSNINASKPLTVATDGACLGNPGPGGWAVIIQGNGGISRLSGSEPETTNNRMELTAAIRAMEAIPLDREAVIQSDSQIVIGGMNEWGRLREARGWRKSNGKPVANADLWRRLFGLRRDRRAAVRWEWVRGHDGHHLNEHADTLARLEAEVAKVALIA